MTLEGRGHELPFKRFYFFIASRNVFSFSADQYLQSSWMNTEE